MITSLLQIPLFQLFGLLILVIIAERSGIPVISLVMKLLKLNGNGKEEGWQKQITEQISLLGSNHIHEVKQAVENMDERGKIRDEGIRDLMKEIRDILSEINRNCFKK